ncbi:agmatine deiminase family protein [Aquimarina mytili]|nr:agmatine deiminase family protein [Aquimarina mytili]
MSLYILMLAIVMFACNSTDDSFKDQNEIFYTMPEEGDPHEGTWLQWPHQYQYGKTFRNRVESTWIDMTRELVSSEKVYIIAYNQTEKNRIVGLLNDEKIPLENIEFSIYKTDDFWVRDNGPIYVRDKNGKLVIQDWGFNGWGEKTDFEKCNAIPQKIGEQQNLPVINLNTIMINEGGSIEIDGKGTLMACRSSILNENRNPGMTQKQAEDIFTKYLGVTNFIWLDGQIGLEITDQHIDGFARFANNKVIITMNRNDLLDFDVKPLDINKLFKAKNERGEPYKFLKLPLTKNNVVTTYGEDLGYKGSYVNYYISNTKVLVPNYNDPNDSIANSKIQSLYPNRTVVGIDVRNVYKNGGMIHCITQQQPK